MTEQTTAPAKLMAALARAQAELQPAPKRGRNPFLKNEYATLDDVIGVIRGPLAAHGLGFMQVLGNDDGGALTLTTILFHESGESIESQVRITAWSDASKGANALQALGGAITYMKRYTLSAMLGIATGEDTDGEGAEAAKKQAPKQAQPVTPKPQPAPATNELDATLGRSPAPKPTNGATRKVASVKVKDWGIKGAEFAREVPYYQKDGQTDWFHITGAAAKCGFDEINDSNLDEVFAELRIYADSHTALAAAEQAQGEQLPF